MVEEKGFVLLGAGLPRTGTSSTREALKYLLKGNVYHMTTVAAERPDHHHIWRKALAGHASPEDWQKIFEDFRGGVDYPVSLFYKEIFKVYPNIKVLLTVRDPVKWYHSVNNSIRRLVMTIQSWPCTWFLKIVGARQTFDLIGEMSDKSPSFSGPGLFSSVGAGQEAAVEFWTKHVEEVKMTIPAENLLIWEVKEGWGPLCNFLGLPQPDIPFPNLNDTAQIERGRRSLLIKSYFVVVGLPVAAASLAWYFGLKDNVSKIPELVTSSQIFRTLSTYF